MAIFMKNLSIFLRVLVGLTFIVSGAAKLFPIEPFEYIFIELGVSNWLLVPFIARFVIAFELFIGASILFDIWLKNKVYYLAQGSLIFFTSYLVYLFITKGNDVDCGCFGSLIQLTPIESIIKNIVLIVMLLFIPRQYHMFRIKIAVGVIVLFSLGLPVILNPIGIHNIQGIEVEKEVDFSGLPPLYKTNQKVDFAKGKKMVAFFSWTCPHCINASRKFVSLDKKQKINNLYYVIASKKEKGLLEFIEKTKPDFPIIWMDNDDFFKYSGGRLPAIVYIEDGVIKKKWFGDLFDVEDIRKYLKN